MRRPPRSTLFPYTTLFRSTMRANTPAHLRSAGQYRPCPSSPKQIRARSEEHTSELQSLRHLVCRLLLERCGDPRDLHSFPTRRSSDLLCAQILPPTCARRASIALARVRRSKSALDRKSTRLNSSHLGISYAVFCLKDAATPEIYTLSLHDALPIYYARKYSRPLALGGPVSPLPEFAEANPR